MVGDSEMPEVTGRGSNPLCSVPATQSETRASETERTLLLVEDNPDEILLMLEALEINGIGNEVAVVQNGVEAVDYLFARGAYSERDPDCQPAVVFLDLKLPRLDGVGVLRAIRSDPATASLPVVILTSSDEERDVVESHRLGVNCFVRKSFDFDSFTRAVEHLAYCYLVLNERPLPALDN